MQRKESAGKRKVIEQERKEGITGGKVSGWKERKEREGEGIQRNGMTKEKNGR